MIRIVTLTQLDDGDLAFLAKTLYRAFGLGTEHAGDRALPREAERRRPGHDAVKLLEDVDPVRTFADDKVLYVTAAPLSLKPGPLGEPPCWGYAEYGGERAVVSTARLPAARRDRGLDRGLPAAAGARVHPLRRPPLGPAPLLRRRAAPCTPRGRRPWPPNPEYDLDTFCREKSERRIRLAKT